MATAENQSVVPRAVINLSSGKTLMVIVVSVVEPENNELFMYARKWYSSTPEKELNAWQVINADSSYHSDFTAISDYELIEYLAKQLRKKYGDGIQIDNVNI